MSDRDLLFQTWKQFGLSENEFNQFTHEQALNYLRFHFNRNGLWEDSVLFFGFKTDYLELLFSIAKDAGLTVYKRNSEYLVFIVIPNNTDKKAVLGKGNKNTFVISEDQFKLLFTINEYILADCQRLYNLSVHRYFKISKPLSNFNINVPEESYSIGSDVIYNVNLFDATCTCKNFTLNRFNYAIGDYRRMCKHLLGQYIANFKPLSSNVFNQFLFKSRANSLLLNNRIR
jgi:hypothetical protein